MTLLFIWMNSDLTINSFIVKDGDRYIKYSIEDVRNNKDSIDNIKISDSGDVIVNKGTARTVILPYNLNNTGGVLIEGFNDFETYCRLNDKLE